VASLTSRTADETVRQTRMLLPMGPALPPIDLQPRLEPPTTTLREAGEGVMEGLEPMASSARRAVGLLLHDLPPMGAEEKSGL
jgi:hypothetical protein